MNAGSLSKTVLLRPEDLAPSRDDFGVIGVFNPGAVEVDGAVLLLVRVAEEPRERRPGLVGLPRWSPDGTVVDWLREDQIEFVDPRVVRIKQTGRVRLTFLSHLRVVRCSEPTAVERIDETSWGPEHEWEEYGVEDPRITQIGDRYWITYVAVSRHGAATALASTHDFSTFERHGIIFPPENKDVVLFPDKIDGQYVALHRPNGATPFTMPEMWLARSPDLIHWGRHEPLYGGRSDWETGRVGGGTPPLRVEGGWLEIYHGNRRPTQAGEVGRYEAAAMLLDAANPARVLARSAEPILTPTEPFERQGFVPDVVFPTGLVAREGRLFIYYGAGDTYTAVVTLPLEETLRRTMPLDK